MKFVSFTHRILCSFCLCHLLTVFLAQFVVFVVADGEHGVEQFERGQKSLRVVTRSPRQQVSPHHVCQSRWNALQAHGNTGTWKHRHMETQELVGTWKHRRS